MTNLEKGQSLFELVVAIAISALIIVAIVSLTTNSIQISNFSKNKALAATYAQQATEWLRGQRDSDPTTFFAKATTPAWCLQNLVLTTPASNPAVNCTGKILAADESVTPFNRWVAFTVNGNVVEVDVVVSWADSQGVHEVINATNLADLRQRQ